MTNGRAGLILRPYQIQAVEACQRKLDQDNRALIVLPTGAGKTVCIAEMCLRNPDDGTLVISHRKNLVRQTIRTLETHTGEAIGREQADNRCNIYAHRIIAGTVQTISRRLGEFDQRHFSLVVIDEAHHHPAKSYRKIERHFSGANLLGVTATPNPAILKIFGEPAFCLELRDAIDQGWLVPIAAKTVNVKGLNLAHLGSVAGDFRKSELDDEMNQDRVIRETAMVAMETSKTRPTIVYTISVRHSQALAELVNRHAGGSLAASMDGGMSDRERRPIMRRFIEGKTKILCNCSLFTEGWDCPQVAAVVIARPTKSRILFAQMVGRGTRTLPGVLDGKDDPAIRKRAIRASGKKNLLVVELRGRLGKHVLATTDMILRHMEEEERERRSHLFLTNGGELATPKQVALLARFGHEAEGWSKKKAGYFIGQIMGRFNKGRHR